MKGLIYDNIQRPVGDAEGRISPTEWINFVIEFATEKKASDIHFDPDNDTFLVRLRIDGILEIVTEQKKEFYEMVVSRLKIMSYLNINERQAPQEGHAQISRANSLGNIDLRISIFPTVHGEAVVIRILNRKEFIFENFEDMGMFPEDAELMSTMIHKPNGMILLTGPSGNGKSATLYTALKQIQSNQKNIVTLEDPVEYQMKYIRQSQIDIKTDYTFAKGMRSILRQDPDVIMIGEIRDNDTAEIAVRAALTGRLLLSTLHTNGTVDAIMRFLEFGIPKSFVATAMRLIVAKRLIRINCKDCAEVYIPNEKSLKEADITDPGIKFYHGKGCSSCDESGFKGRTGIYEFFIIDQDIQALIVESASFSKIMTTAKQKGLRTLRRSAVDLASLGQTTLEEALHITA